MIENLELWNDNYLFWFQSQKLWNDIKLNSQSWWIVIDRLEGILLNKMNNIHKLGVHLIYRGAKMYLNYRFLFGLESMLILFYNHILFFVQGLLIMKELNIILQWFLIIIFKYRYCLLGCMSKIDGIRRYKKQFKNYIPVIFKTVLNRYPIEVIYRNGDSAKVLNQGFLHFASSGLHFHYERNSDLLTFPYNNA